MFPATDLIRQKKSWVDSGSGSLPSAQERSGFREHALKTLSHLGQILYYSLRSCRNCLL